MQRLVFAILCVSIGITTLCSGKMEGYTGRNFTNKSNETFRKILSRRRRYLIFPEGSSLQLVYCLTMPVIGESTIFTIGGTAALAWELPHDPFQPYRKPAELLHRKDPPGEYTVADPISPDDASASKKQIQVAQLQHATAPIRYSYRNPISTVRFPTIHYSPAYNRYRYQNYQTRRRQQFAQQQQIDAWKPEETVYYPRLPIQPARASRVTPVNNGGRLEGAERYRVPPEVSTSSIYHQVHRRTRRDLYGKIEKFLSTQTKDGKACLLRAICEIYQTREEKGSFMQEIMKAIFRVKPFEEHKNEDIYDHAANKSHNCKELYSNCDSSILSFI